MLGNYYEEYFRVVVSVDSLKGQILSNFLSKKFFSSLVFSLKDYMTILCPTIFL